MTKKQQLLALIAHHMPDYSSQSLKQLASASEEYCDLLIRLLTADDDNYQVALQNIKYYQKKYTNNLQQLTTELSQTYIAVLETIEDHQNSTELECLEAEIEALSTKKCA